MAFLPLRPEIIIKESVTKQCIPHTLQDITFLLKLAESDLTPTAYSSSQKDGVLLHKCQNIY